MRLFLFGSLPIPLLLLVFGALWGFAPAQAGQPVANIRNLVDADEATLNPGRITIILNPVNTMDVIVNFTVTGTAVPGTDYTAIGNAVTIPANQGYVNIPVTPIKVTMYKGNTTVILTLTGGTGYTIGDPATGTVNILVPPPKISIFTTMNANESTNTPGKFMVMATPPSATAITVNLLVLGSAVPGTDIMDIDNTVTIPATQDGAEITVTPIQDSMFRSSDVIISILDGDGYVVGTLITAYMFITDSGNTVKITGTMDANAATNSPGQFTVVRTGPMASEVAVSFVVSGTAVPGTDYTDIGTTVTIPANNASATISVMPLVVMLYNGSPTVTVTLVPSPNYNVGTPGSATIKINVPLPVVTLAATGNAETASNTPGSFTVTANPPSAAALTVNFSVGGSAIAGTDYSPIGTSVVIPAGEASADIAVAPIQDTNYKNSSVFVSLTTGAGYNVGSPHSASISITDAAPPTPVVTIAATSNANEATNTPGVFTVSRNPSSAVALTVNFIVSGSAVAGVDYTSIGTSVTIPANQATATINVAPIQDSNFRDSTVTVALTSGTRYNLGNPSSDTVMLSDPVVNNPVVTIVATTHANEATNTPGVFTVTRSSSSSAALTVNFMVGGSAVAGTDYTSIGTSVNIPANQTTATITVAPIQDTNYNDSTVMVTLSNGAGYTVGNPANATVMISDPAPVNHAPVFTSAPIANPDPALAGQSIDFVTAASDADSDPLTYSWNFGDSMTAQGASVSHSYPSAGTYNVSVTVSDGKLSATQMLIVTVADSESPAPTSIALKFNFLKPNKDSLTVVGTLPLAAGYVPAGDTISVSIGGYQHDFPLNAKGIGGSGNATFKLKGKLKNGVFSNTPLVYTLKLNNQDLYSVLKDDPGFSKTISDPAIAFPILIGTNKNSFLANTTVRYTTNGKAGVATKN